MSRNSSNQPAAPNAANFLNNFKYEVANELGMNNYQTVDKGQLTSRENGYVGGGERRGEGNRHGGCGKEAGICRHGKN